MLGSEYPTEPHIRRHGPEGYRNYESYRDWLRDEFMFRCVYCLHREQWYNRPGTFHIDHFVPLAVDPDGRLVYSNLIYACGTCNEAKRAILGIPDPGEIAFADCVRVVRDGTVKALNDDGEALIQCLRLNNKPNIRQRWLLIENLTTLEHANPGLFREYMRFPDDLPDLRSPKRRVPNNTRPDGVENCYFALRERGDLPTIY